MDYFKSQPSCESYFKEAYGYAIYETIGKGGIFFVGGAVGQGDVYVINKEGEADKRVGSSTMMQASLGPQLGGQVYSMIIFFQTERDYERFITENFEFGADANAVAVTASAAAKFNTLDNNINIQAGVRGTKHSFKHTTNTLPFTKGMAIFTTTMGGLMYEASLCGQKFKFKPIE